MVGSPSKILVAERNQLAINLEKLIEDMFKNKIAMVEFSVVYMTGLSRREKHKIIEGI
jgi:hypothetical protein